MNLSKTRYYKAYYYRCKYAAAGAGAAGAAAGAAAKSGLAGKALGLGMSALGFLGPIGGAVSGATAGYQAGDWLAHKMGVDPGSTWHNVLRYGGGALGGAAGAYIGWNLGPIGKAMGRFGRGLVGVKGNKNWLANMAFGKVGKAGEQSMGGVTGFFGSTIPLSAMTYLGARAASDTAGMRFDNRTSDAMNRQNYAQYY